MKRRSVLFAFATASLVWCQSKQSPEDSGKRYVEYELSGSVHSARITFTNATGDISQKDVEVPYSDKFFVPIGTFVSISGQKKLFKKLDNSHVVPQEEVIDDGQHGTLHVAIKVGGVVFKEAETDAAFGIAQASGKVEDRKIYY